MVLNIYTFFFGWTWVGMIKHGQGPQKPKTKNKNGKLKAKAGQILSKAGGKNNKKRQKTAK